MCEYEGNSLITVMLSLLRFPITVTKKIDIYTQKAYNNDNYMAASWALSKNM